MKIFQYRTQACSLIFLLFFGMSLFAGQWETIKPDGGKKTTLKIHGKSRTYYYLAPGKALDVKLDSDVAYRIITRANLGKSKKEQVYTFRIGFDDPKGDLYSRATGRDKKAKIKNQKGYVGESRIIDLNDIPKDASMMSIRLDKKAKKGVFFRIQQEKEEYSDNQKYIAITPVGYMQSVGISTNEKISNYYEIDSDGKLSVQVIGPTTLKILARVMLDDAMRGTIKLPIAVYEDGALKNTYYLSTRNSQVSIILDRPGLLPSKGETFYVEVPSGNHRYSFALPENDHEVVLRFFIPEQHLTNKAK